jgi:hypothetical protein
VETRGRRLSRGTSPSSKMLLESVGLLRGNLLARKFGRRMFLPYALQFSRYATSFVSAIVGTCTSSSNSER